MENQIVNIKLNQDGNQIIATEQSGSGEIQTIKYGIIKLMGDKKDYRVSFKTLVAIEKAREANFGGSIKIPELGMSVMANQIVLAKSETEQVKFTESFTNLPTTNIVLDENCQLTDRNRSYFIQHQLPHYEATVHYWRHEGEIAYELDSNKIKRLVKSEFIDGYEVVVGVWEYGVKKL